MHPYIEKVISVNEGKNNSIYFTRTPNKFKKTNKISLINPTKSEKYLIDSESLGNSDIEINKNFLNTIKEDVKKKYRFRFQNKMFW